jgi:hypothetical protein
MDADQVNGEPLNHQRLHLLPCVLLSLIVSAAWPGWITSAQQIAKSPPAHSTNNAISYAFVSPNTRENLTLPEAIAGLSSLEEKRLVSEAHQVACRLHLALRVKKAVGSWSDGAEHSTVIRVTTNKAKLRYASSWLGKFARQKAVLYFRRDPLGAARMFVLLVPRRNVDLAAIGSELDADGVENRTLILQRTSVLIYVVDLKNELTAKVVIAAKRLRARLSSLRGAGEFIGDDNDRDKARAVFDQEIMKYQAGHPGLPRTCGKKGSTKRK